MKIVILTEHYFEYAIGGAEYQISLLARELLKAGHELHYIFIAYGHNPKPTININLHPLKARLLSRKFGHNFFLYRTDINEMLNSIRPDLIYQRVASAFTGIAARYARKNECKLVWHIAHESNTQPAWFKTLRTAPFDYINKKYVEYGIRHTDYIIGQAKYQDTLLKENYGRKCDLIVGNFHPSPSEQIVNKPPVKVIWVANFKPIKQPELFIKLSREFINDDNVEFVMIGREANKGYQYELSRKMKCAPNLKYFGELSNAEVNRILSESHIFVNTSISEGFPNTFIQAWLREVPVVSLNVDPDDVLKVNNIGFHSESYEKLVSDTKRLIDDTDLRKEMGSKAQIYARKMHTIESNVPQIISLFEK